LRDTRLHGTAAHARRLLDRPLRRDDRPRPSPRTAALDRGHHLSVRDRRARASLHARPERAWERDVRRARPDDAPEPAPDAPRLRVDAPVAPPARVGGAGGAAAWLNAFCRDASFRPIQTSRSPTG